jgi:hypothetical protein
MERRRLLARLAALPLFAGVSTVATAADQKRALKVMMKSAWGSDDPTKAAFPFLHGYALAGRSRVVGTWNKLGGADTSSQQFCPNVGRNRFIRWGLPAYFRRTDRHNPAVAPRHPTIRNGSRLDTIS